MNQQLTHNGYELDLLTVPEAAKLLRISRNLAYELVARHELPSIRFGRVIRVPRSALECWLRDTAVTSSKTQTPQHSLSCRR